MRMIIRRGHVQLRYNLRLAIMKQTQNPYPHWDAVQFQVNASTSHDTV